MGNKTLYVCPHCHKQVKDLKGHIARKHPEVATKEAIQSTSVAKSTGKKLELDIKVKPKAPPAVTTYHCIECGNKVERGQNSCPQCGALLDWSQIK